MTGIEQEYRYLVELPANEVLQAFGEPYRIEQIYLTPKEGIDSRRIRKRMKDGEEDFFYTEKTCLSYAKNLESERKISSEEYQELKLQQYGNVLNKTRYVFDYQNFKFELDVYSFTKCTAVLEVETNLTESEIPFPPFLRLLKPLTGKKEYSNFALSQKIPKDLK